MSREDSKMVESVLSQLVEPLECMVQLHESVNVIYVVDGYRAELTTNDNMLQIVAVAEGKTIIGALLKLARILEKANISLREMRKLKEGEKIDGSL